MATGSLTMGVRLATGDAWVLDLFGLPSITSELSLLPCDGEIVAEQAILAYAFS